MVLIDTVSFKVDSSVEHLATDWEVSDTKDFSNILLSSYQDYKNKTGIIFSDNLSTNKKYYARARGLLSTGYTRWGNIDVFSVINDTDLQPQDILPSRVSVPILSTYRINTSAGIYSLLKKNQQEPTPDTNPAPDYDYTTPDSLATGDSQSFDNSAVIRSLLEETNPGSHDLTLFEIWAEGFETIGTAKHLATTWWIENKDGDVIWSKIKDQIYTTRVEFNNTILKSDEVYRIKAVFHTDSNDVSQIGSLTIVTGYCGEIEVSTYLDAIDYSVDLDLQITWMPGLESIHWEILSFEGNLINSVWSTTTSSILTVLPKGTLKRNVNYILRVQTNLEDCYKYIPFITTDSLEESPDDPITPLLIYPTDITLYKNDTTEIFMESQVDHIEYKNNDTDIFEFDETTKLIRGKKIGTGTMTVIGKKEGYTANYITITVTVIEDKGSTIVNDKYIKLSPTTLEVAQGEKAMLTAVTNCEKLIYELVDDLIAVDQYADDVFEITGLKMGYSTLMIIGYDADGTTTSKIIDIKVTKGSLDPDEPEPEPEPELIFTVDKDSLNLKSNGGIATVNVITNAMFWDVYNVTNTDVVTVEKITMNTLRFVGGDAGESIVTLVANDGEKDLGEIDITVITAKISLPTTFEPLDLINHAEINKDVIIEFNSNITEVGEYDLTYDTSLLELKLKGTERIIFNVKEAAAGKTVSVSVIAHKTQTESIFYSDCTASFNVTVKQASHPKEDILRLPDAADDGKRYYAGTTYTNNVPAAPNPVPYHFYVNREVTIDNISVISPIWEDGTGSVINTVLDAYPILDSSSKYFEFKKFEFGLVTNPTDLDNPVGINNSNHNFVVNISVTYENDTYVENIVLNPLEQLYLNFVLNDTYLDKDTTINANVFTNGTTLEFQSSNKAIAELVEGTYTDTATGRELTGVYIQTKAFGTVKLTVTAKNRANEAVLAENVITVVDPSVTTNLEVTASAEVIEGCSVPFEITTDDDATVTYDYEDAYLTIDSTNKTITGKLNGTYTVTVKAVRPNGRPVIKEMEVIVYAANDVPRDIIPAVENLTVDSEETTETTFRVFKDSTVSYELVPDLGKLTLTDITESTPATTADTDDTTTEEKPKLTPTYSSYKLSYVAPLTTTDTNVVVKLNANYQTLEMNDKDVNILVNKKVMPSGATINNTMGTTIECGKTYTLTATRPDTTTVSYSVPAACGVSKTEWRILSNADGIITDKITITTVNVIPEDTQVAIIMTTYYKGIQAEVVSDTTTTLKSNIQDEPVFEPTKYEVLNEGVVTGTITTNDYVDITYSLDPDVGELTVTKVE